MSSTNQSHNRLVSAEQRNSQKREDRRKFDEMLHRVYEQASKEAATSVFTEPTEGAGIGTAYLYLPNKPPIKVIAGFTNSQDFVESLRQNLKEHYQRLEKLG